MISLWNRKQGGGGGVATNNKRHLFFSLVFFLSTVVVVVHGAPWFGGGGSSSTGEEAAATKDEPKKKQPNPNQNDWLVSPIINRELETSVVAHNWPSNPQNILCEGLGFVQSTYANDGPRQELTPAEKTKSIELQDAFLSALLQELENNMLLMTYGEATDLVERAYFTATTTTSDSGGDNNKGNTNTRLLRYALSLRAHSPQCELHRGLARQKLSQVNQLATFDLPDTPRNAFVVVYPGGSLVLEEDIPTTDWTTFSHDVVTDADDNFLEDLLLPGEFPFGSATTTTESGSAQPQLLILYANFGTPGFVQAYNKLKADAQNIMMNVRFVVRYLGAVHYEELGPNALTQPTKLQGYGVRLDIRNVEYKVFDDRSDGTNNDDENNGMVNLKAAATAANVQKQPPTQFLAGVNYTTLLLSMEDEENADDADADDDATTTQKKNKKKTELLTKLWKQHEGQQANLIPPNWQRRKLPLQATSVIANSKDPLMTLEEVSLNLPSVASTLVHHKVTEDIEDIAHKFEEELQPVLPTKSSGPVGGGHGTGVLLINGRQVNQLDRPTFNMFELLNVLRKEQTAMQKLQNELSPYLPNNKILHQIKEAWTRGDDFLDVVANLEDEDGDDSAAAGADGGGGAAPKHYRIDVGRGWKQCIMYLNDIEKDPKYAQWPRQVRQVFMAMQFGMPPSIRRNLFTLLAVMDPLVVKDGGVVKEEGETEADDDEGSDSDDDDTKMFQNVGITLGKQLMQSNYPARLGVLLVGDQDVKDCAAWVGANPDSKDGEACPAFGKTPIVDDPEITKGQHDKLKKIPASTRALHRLVAELTTNYPGEMIDAYLEYVLQSLEDQKTLMGKNTLHDLVEIHSNTLNGMRLGGGQTKHFKDAVKLLTTAEDDDADADSTTKPKYGKTVRFAVDKGLYGGMSFVNGRPLPPGDPQEVFDKAGKIFNEEMQHIFGLIQTGEIKDSTPKSVYGHFLTGKGVYKKVHPLLMDSKDKGESYIKTPHKFDSKSLLFPSESADKVKAAFVVDAILDVGSKKGLQIAKSLLSVMDDFPAAIKNDSGDKMVGIKIGYRIVPSRSSSLAKAMCPILANAGDVGSTALLPIFDAAIAGLTEDRELGLTDLLDASDGLSETVKEAVRQNLEEGACSGLVDSSAGDNVIASNGLFYALETPSLTKDDVELLLSMDLDYAKAVTYYLKNDLSVKTPEGIDGMGRTAHFLAREAASSSFERLGLESVVSTLENQLGIDKNPLRFSWNENESDELQLKITAFVDPTAEMCQRMAPLLRVFRDSLRLPLTLILTPRTILDADAKAPVTSFYRYVADPLALQDSSPPKATFANLPKEHTLTLRLDVPESWDVQQSNVVQDTDNLRCDAQVGCSDEAYTGTIDESVPIHQRDHLTKVEYGLNSLLIFGQCYETKGSSPNGLQLTLTRKQDLRLHLPAQEGTQPQEIEVGMDGTIKATDTVLEEVEEDPTYADTLVMKTVGYWQLRANPGVWKVQIAKDSKGAEIFNIVDGMVRRGQIKVLGQKADNTTKQVVMKDFINRGELLLVQRRKGFEKAKLFSSDAVDNTNDDDEEVIHVFSLATGHLYERFLKIMMLSVTRRTSTKVKFWLFENFLSPSFKSSARYMAEQIGCEVEFVTYKWPEWLRGQSEKQRIIWGYKILFLDVLFPLNVKKIIYVDADQVIRGDLKELWDMDLQGAPYGYTPMCSSRESTIGYAFWRTGFWESHLQGRPYHISALYVVDLEKFRKQLVGDQLRGIYQQLSADPNSLANLDQDLPNYAQHAVPIFSLPQEWLWCESWCSDETKKDAKTIDLCNNPLHKEPKVSMAKRVISGPLFKESWVELDEIVEGYQKDWLATTTTTASAN